MEYRADDVAAVLRLPKSRRAGAYVMRERGNEYDEWACAVIVDSRPVGYLRSHVAKRYGPLLDVLERHGLAAWTGCQLVSEWEGAVQLPDPDVFARAVAAAVPRPPVVEPIGRRFELWGCPSWAGTDIDGEAEHMMHLYELIEGQSSGFELPAVLVPHAGRWRVVVQGGEVGYLQPATERSHSEVLNLVLSAGMLPVVPAQVSWNEDHPAGPWPWVRLRLGDPIDMVPRDAPPAAPHEVLPQGRKLKIAHPDAESAAEIVAAWTGSPIGRVLVHGLLAEDGAAKPHVSVEVGGSELGTFTPAVSKHLVPLVRTVEGQGLRAVAGVEIVAMPGVAEVTVLARRAVDTPAEWFQDRIGSVER